MKKAKLGNHRSLLIRLAFGAAGRRPRNKEYRRGVVDAIIAETLDSGLGFEAARSAALSQVCSECAADPAEVEPLLPSRLGATRGRAST